MGLEGNVTVTRSSSDLTVIRTCSVTLSFLKTFLFCTSKNNSCQFNVLIFYSGKPTSLTVHENVKSVNLRKKV